MARWSHPKPEIRHALDEAHTAGLRVEPTTAHGHSWGYIDCVYPDCTDPRRRYYVNSTPRDQDIEAARIRRFIRRHLHPCNGGQPSG